MSAQHTPGPLEHDHDEYVICADAGNPMQRIATVTMFLPEYRAESAANARLIAAAPDLLEALQRLSAQCARLRMPGQPMSDAEKASLVAIAKALGEVA